MTNSVESTGDNVAWEPIFDGGWISSSDPKVVKVWIETKDLILRSIEETDKEDYKKLWTDYETMKKYQGNECRYTKAVAEMGDEVGKEHWKQEQITRIEKAVAMWAKRWQEGDRFSAFAIFDKETNKFMGNVVAGHGDNPGEAELAYIVHQHYWNKGYGSQAVDAVVNRWLGHLKEQKAKIPFEKDGKVELIDFAKVIATVRQDNLFSIRILEKNGFTKEREETIDNYQRSVYVKQV